MRKTWPVKYNSDELQENRIRNAKDTQTIQRGDGWARGWSALVFWHSAIWRGHAGPCRLFDGWMEEAEKAMEEYKDW